MRVIRSDRDETTDEDQRGKSCSEVERSTPGCGSPLREDTANLQAYGTSDGGTCGEGCEGD